MNNLLEVNSVMLAIFGISIFGAISSLSKALLKQQEKKQKEKEILYDSNRTAVRADEAEFQSKVYAIEDSLLA